MEIIITGEVSSFNVDLFKDGGVIRAKYHTWSEPRMGLVAYADKNILRVLFQTGVNVSTSYFKIKVDEVLNNLWAIKYSPDMEHFYDTDDLS